MSEQEKQDSKGNTPEEHIILENANPESNTENIDKADEIKSRIEGDLNELNEKESEKDWAAELKAVEDKYLRLYAEFDNFRRRTAAERLELFKTANQEVLVALLPVLDDFERAMKSMQNAGDVNAVKEGVDLVSTKLRSILIQKGLKPMECVGKEFDSEFHEAITKIPAPTEELKGKVVDEVEKGYFLNDKVVRYAKVVVGE
jgi:molecular chaperone GrpE